MSPSSSDQEALKETINSTLTLLGQFTSSLQQEQQRQRQQQQQQQAAQKDRVSIPTNALHTLGDAAKLLKSQTTKLSLLCITPPFTASAVAKVVRETTGTSVAAMVSAAQTCTRERDAIYGAFLTHEVTMAVRRTLAELDGLLREILLSMSTATSRTGEQRQDAIWSSSSLSSTGATNGGGGGVDGGGNGRSGIGGGGGGGRDGLSRTGSLWECCDALVELDALGVAGMAVKKAEQWRETVRDAIAELREWRCGADLASESPTDRLLESDDEGVDGDHDSIDDIFHAANSLPPDRPDLEKLVVEAEAALAKVVILYSAVAKRRLKAYRLLVSRAGKDDAVQRGDGSDLSRLDDLMAHLKRIPHLVDELAGCFYDLDAERTREMLERCIAEAKEACELARAPWDGVGEDKYSEWFAKWIEITSGVVGSVQ